MLDDDLPKILPILVQDEGSSHCTQLEQSMPIGGVARQARDFRAHDDARLAHRDFAHEQLESIAPRCWFLILELRILTPGGDTSNVRAGNSQFKNQEWPKSVISSSR